MGRIYINPTVEKQIMAYCEINNINDVNAFANRCALQGLNIFKYGVSPTDNIDRENKGIKDIKKNEKINKQEENNTVREDKGEQIEPQINEESGENKEEKVKVKKIRIVKKQ